MSLRVLEPFAGYSRPAHHARPKLTPAQREEVAYRRGDGDSLANIARDYGVSTSLIGAIAIRERP